MQATVKIKKRETKEMKKTGGASHRDAPSVYKEKVTNYKFASQTLRAADDNTTIVPLS